MLERSRLGKIAQPEPQGHFWLRSTARPGLQELDTITHVKGLSRTPQHHAERKGLSTVHRDGYSISPGQHLVAEPLGWPRYFWHAAVQPSQSISQDTIVNRDPPRRQRHRAVARPKQEYTALFGITGSIDGHCPSDKCRGCGLRSLTNQRHTNHPLRGPADVAAGTCAGPTARVRRAGCGWWPR